MLCFGWCICSTAAVTADTSNFDQMFTRAWDELHKLEKSPFRYKVGVVDLRIVGRFLAQKCPGRAWKRPLGRVVERVVATLNPEEFNFGKVQSRELMFSVDRHKNSVGIVDGFGNFTAVIINVSPILRYHFVIAPVFALLQPQVLTRHAVEAAGDVLSLGGESMRLLYNSLGGAASVNHLHFQGYYIASNGFPSSFPIETEAILWHSQEFGEVSSWPLHTLIVLATSSHELSVVVDLVIERLLHHNVAHHLLLAKRSNGYVAYIIARRMQQRFDSRYINVAVNEAVGWFICPDTAEFESLTESGAATMLSRWRLTEEMWQSLDIVSFLRSARDAAEL
eukprot:TRINITY_DN22663_c0_g1_i1.p1 TRINITY_DN22663_c0_g1~~TRINITY_DN22663_c0_g1_i1.p1  ORF type:complete len:367 (+),score=58.87 TRINITY_DN22663_c0_g1_i1:92-1102(+)